MIWCLCNQQGHRNLTGKEEEFIAYWLVGDLSFLLMSTVLMLNCWKKWGLFQMEQMCEISPTWHLRIVMKLLALDQASYYKWQHRIYTALIHCHLAWAWALAVLFVLFCIPIHVSTRVIEPIVIESWWICVQNSEDNKNKKVERK